MVVRSSVARPERDPQRRITVAILAGVTFLRLLWLAGHPIDLYPDEAQYWIWAQHPAWGYFSKPPMVAWMIWASNQLLGPSDFTTKLPATLTYFCTSMLVYRIAERLYDGRIAGWAAIAFITLPSVSLSSVIISTDVPLLFFWSVATYGLVRAREPGASRVWWLLVGLAAGLGLLSKYAMGFWIGSALGFLLAFRDERRHVTSSLAAMVLALAIYAPNFLWNRAHGFASYHHTAANANLHGFALHPDAFAAFAGSQFGVFGPIFAGTLILIALGASRRPSAVDRTTWLLLALSLPTLAIMLVESMLSRAQPNWSAPAYLAATILVVAWLYRQGREALVQWSVVLHLAVAVLAFGAHDIAHAVGLPLPGKLDPVHRLRGWHSLGEAVSSARDQAPTLPLLGDSRELMAALIYYMEPHPFDMRMWNPGGTANNGFEMTQSLPDRPGGDYLWISDRASGLDVTAHFQRHVELMRISVPIGRGLAREVTLTALYGFKGYGR
jgi:4-amino-4-deoxy-L-arabinose transferase-like glycosyltransferase